MKLFRKKSYRDTAGAIAAIILAIACLVAAVYHTRVLIDLNHRGVKVTATVVDFDRGSRNSKWAVYLYITRSGQETTARDAFQQYVKGVDKGSGGCYLR